MTTQHQMILIDLLKGWRLTPLDSSILHGCSKLSTRVGELKRQYDWPIQKKMIEVNTRFGKKRVMQYFL